MDFRHKETGVIYHVTNEHLLSNYKDSKTFEEVKTAAPVKEKDTKKKAEK